MLTPGDVQIGTEWEADEEITIDRTTDRFCRQVGPGGCRTDRRLMDLDATDQAGSLAYSMVVPVDPGIRWYPSLRTRRGRQGRSKEPPHETALPVHARSNRRRGYATHAGQPRRQDRYDELLTRLRPALRLHRSSTGAAATASDLTRRQALIARRAFMLRQGIDVERRHRRQAPEPMG